VDTNITTGTYPEVYIAPDGRTYFAGPGIKVLEITCSDKKYLRKYGE
jgi:hypothetical protein